tara:strand:+ start:2024 stop:2674 length:651 start_codon:yes stop_codon:yes gene_type:complete
MKSLFSIAFFFVFTITSHAQINVQLLHQLVDDSKKEYNLQKEAKDNQAKNAFNEEVNNNLFKTVKEKYRTVQDRFAKLSIAIDAVGIATTADPLIRSIIDNQQQIVFFCQDDPQLILFAIETEKVFVDRSYSLFNYLLGLSASIGVINQMKVSERRVLFQHIINELHDINALSYTTARTLESHIRSKMGGDPYLNYINQEMGIVNEIIANAKTLTQ